MFTTFDAPPRPRRGTALMRALGLLFVAAVAIATLYPASGWRAGVESPLGFLAAGLPRWWTWFDVLSNAFAYAVLGLLLALGWGAGLAPWRAIASVGAACAALSLSLEAAQTFLPNRVPSLLDWLSNAGGGAAGAWLGATLNGAVRRGDRIAVPVRDRWYEQGPPAGWVLLVTWLAAQLVPQRLLFATGHVEPYLRGAFDALLPGDAPDLSRTIWAAWGGAAPAGTGVAIEAAAVICAVCAVGSLVLALVQGSRARLVLLAGVAAVAFALRSVATQMVYGPSAPFAWLTPGAQGGLVVGAVLLYGLDTLGPRTRAACAAAAAAIGLALVNLAPADRYFETMLTGVQAGRLANLHGSLRVVSVAWPLLAIAFFWRLARPRARRAWVA